MQSLSPTSRYLLALKEGSHQPDDVQQEAVSRLDTIYQELQTQPAPVASGGGLRAKFGKLLGKREPAAGTAPVRGLYMWGGVGRGKTLSLIHISEPTRHFKRSRMPSSA